MKCLSKIVGANDARRYASRTGGDLDEQNEGSSLLNYEAVAIYAYSTELTWHDRINSELWSGSPSPEVTAFANVLNGALAKLPPYMMNNKTVYRGYKPDDFQAFIDRHQKGLIITYPAFTSATFKVDLAFRGNVLFIIRTLTGKAIWYHAANYDEMEVLIPCGRSFLVVDTDLTGTQAVITMDEMP